jgi:DnaJ family protein A protein 2
MDPGNVIVVLNQKEHPTFRREGCDLHLKKKLTLVEALCGFSFKVEHLDGRVLVVKSHADVCYKPGDIKGIKEEGMPMQKHPSTKGHLYIELDIEFPKMLTSNVKQVPFFSPLTSAIFLVR